MVRKLPYNLLINVNTANHEIAQWRLGKLLLKPLFANEKLFPIKASNLGEVTSKVGVEVQDLDACGKLWATKTLNRSGGRSWEGVSSFFWKRTKKIKSSGMVNFPFVNLKGKKVPGQIFFEADALPDNEWLSLFKVWCETTQAYAGLMHPLVSKDGPEKSSRDARDYSLEESVQSQAWSRFLGGELRCEFRAGDLNSLVSGFTNLGWATYFGDEYAHEVDADAISAAGFPVQEIGGGYLVQVTEDINDTINDFAMFSKRRAELKSQFRDDLFLIKDEPKVS